jgi:hypothetical protein
MRKGINPQLKKGDRVVLIHMDGESIGPGTKGKVLNIEQVPVFGEGSNHQYRVEWYDDDNKVISTLSLLPDMDGWILDMDTLDESKINSMDDLIKIGEFLTLFNRKELNEICEFLELERRLGLHNMFSEGGKFLLVGPEYIKDYIKLKSYDEEFSEDEELIIDKIIERSQGTRDLFVSKAIEHLENNNKEVEIPKVQKTMKSLLHTAKQFWMDEANKYTNKEIQ